MADISQYLAAYNQALASGDMATASLYQQHLAAMGYGQMAQMPMAGLGQTQMGGGMAGMASAIPGAMAMPQAGIGAFGLTGLDMTQQAGLGAAPNLAAKALESERQVGTIKNFDESKGFGFIDCPAARQATGLDVFLMRSNLNGQAVNPGDRVTFTLVQTSKGPRADNVKVLAPGEEPPPPAAAPLAAATGEVPAVAGADAAGMMAGMSVGLGGLTGFSGLGMGLDLQSMGLAGMGGLGGLGLGGMQMGAFGLGSLGLTGLSAATGSYVGTIKSFDDSRGFGFIDCEVTRRSTGKDVLLLRSQLNGAAVKMGDKVSFNVEDNNGKGLKATSVAIISAEGLLITPQDIQDQRQAVLQATGSSQQFTGEIKQYDDNKGYGFIDCAETMQLYNKDIFLLRSSMKDNPGKVGDRISFTVSVGTKGPVAENVSVLPAGSEGGFGAARGSPGGDGRSSPY
eukprot:TRINITY_DN5803_c0_g1_i1.p1 TRINITY_DN5803_c0_g1~~TRINITY_DN5803_c0_g1_i1.p1  ORF type:complete len:454 (-),score=85.69 TRINITY_DN5803_c0_g1_i1:112-1473(-)